ncbi:MAG: putative Co/Zn/Cd efflux system rane fusion protein, partial [Labilithrix sp.]|nr:putative Co/Zn/Cd efflux system rane fusion protein [Labilithrix sp.]
MTRRRSEPFILCAVLLGAATGCSSSKAAPPPPSEAVSVPKPATKTVGARPIATYLSLTGQLKSGRETDLAANASGRVTATSVERGARVKAGDVVATLDVRAAALSAAEARANAETAAASADSANTECERTRALVASGALGKADLDRVEAQCKTSVFAVSAAQARSRLAAQNVG